MLFFSVSQLPHLYQQLATTCITALSEQNHAEGQTYRKHISLRGEGFLFCIPCSLFFNYLKKPTPILLAFNHTLYLQITLILIRKTVNIKVHVFLGQKKIFTADLTLCSTCQIGGEDFVNFCGSLRKHGF